MMLLGGAARASEFSPLGYGLAKPEAYESPSRTYSLHVHPHDRFGLRSASYRLTKNGQEVWSADKTYTLRAVTTTDAGFAVGIAYRSVPVERDGKPWDPMQYFHVVILNEQGTEVLNQEEERLPQSFSSTPPTPRSPYAQQLLVDPDNDRVVLRLVEGDGFVGTIGWRIYRLSTGVLLHQFNPHERDTKIGNRWWVVDTGLIKGTPLIVTHWYTSGPTSYTPKERSGRFTVVAGDGRPVWSYRVEGDYTHLDLKPKIWGGVVADYFGKQPAILPTNEKQHFQIRFFATGEVKTYRVERDSIGNWTVSETDGDSESIPDLGAANR